MTVYDALGKVQAKLKAPKNQRNSFGGYNYRSCEDILEAVKPLLSETGATLAISDEVLQVGERYYVCSTACFTCDGESIAVQGWARETDSRKGMDDSQITGSASSYARKYALNGLFLIDDTKDADATNTHGKDAKPKPAKTAQLEDPIKAQKAKLYEAIKGFAERRGADIEKMVDGVKKRPDYQPDNLLWLEQVTEEFINE